MTAGAQDLTQHSTTYTPTHAYEVWGVITETFADVERRWLFGDYMGCGLNTVLLFAPAVDPRISVKAKLGEGEAGWLCAPCNYMLCTFALCSLGVQISVKAKLGEGEAGTSPKSIP
jgi:hypothetical protein